jgi:hypothetical protein
MPSFTEPDMERQNPAHKEKMKRKINKPSVKRDRG